METPEVIAYFDVIRANIRLSISKDRMDISFRTLADKADIDFSNFISFMNHESKDIKLSTVIKIARALELTPQQLLEPIS